MRGGLAPSIAGALLLGVALSPAAHAQKWAPVTEPERIAEKARAQVEAAQEEKAPEPLPEGVRGMLNERERERLHPAIDPLVVIGIDEAGGAFRAGTPMLERAVAAPVEVDLDELRERKLAMYTSGERFTGPPRTFRTDPVHARPGTEDPSLPQDASGEPLDEPGDGSRWPWIVLAAAASAWLALRRRAV